MKLWSNGIKYKDDLCRVVHHQDVAFVINLFDEIFELSFHKTVFPVHPLNPILQNKSKGQRLVLVLG